MEKKKILFIIWSFTYGGGAERVLANIVNNLDKNRYDIDIIEYWHTNINNEEINDNVTLLEPIIDADNDSILKKILYKILLYVFPYYLRKKYIKNNYDMQISFNYLIPTFLLDKKCKTYAWVHGDVYDLNNDKLNYVAQKKSFKNVNKIVAISNNTKKSLLEVFPEYKNKIVLINNGFNIQNIIDKSTSFEVKNKKKTILFINRFDNNKNPLFAIEVAKKLVDAGYDFKMQFIGKGDLLEQMNKRISELKIEKYIDILGYQKNPYPYIKNAHIVIGCSYSEGFPTIFVEAITLGVPFVSTNVGGVLEISNNEQCGFIANDIEEFVSKIELLMDDAKLYSKFSKEAVDYSKNFSIENQIKNIEKMIGDKK